MSNRSLVKVLFANALGENTGHSVFERTVGAFPPWGAAFPAAIFKVGRRNAGRARRGSASGTKNEARDIAAGPAIKDDDERFPAVAETRQPRQNSFSYACFLRRIAPANATRPVPISIRLPGSGTSQWS
jgi:hypothetical protein